MWGGCVSQSVRPSVRLHFSLAVQDIRTYQSFQKHNSRLQYPLHHFKAITSFIMSNSTTPAREEERWIARYCSPVRKADSQHIACTYLIQLQGIWKLRLIQDNMLLALLLRAHMCIPLRWSGSVVFVNSTIGAVSKDDCIYDQLVLWSCA